MDEITIFSGSLRSLDTEEKKVYPKYKYVTDSESVFCNGHTKVVVPNNFLTDGSSGGPDYGRSWLFHDYLYATHKFESGQECTRKEADKIMYMILRMENLSWYCWLFNWIAWLNPLWLFSRAWKNSGKRGPEFYYHGKSE